MALRARGHSRLNAFPAGAAMSTEVNSRNVEVGLVQINTTFDQTLYLPYSVGLLQAYTLRYAHHPERYRFRLPVMSRSGVEAAAQSLCGADVVGFSAYVWNYRYSLAIARRLR